MPTKSLILIFLLTCIIPQLVLAQTPATSDVPVPVSPVKWEPRQIDVGKVPFGVPVIQDFMVKNGSDAVLQILNVRTGCHCTTADWTPDLMGPGSIGMVRVTFDALKEGEFYKVIIVSTNQDTGQPIGLILKGEVEKKPVATGQ